MQTFERVQYTSKGTLDGGFIDKQAQRMHLRDALRATQATADAAAVAAAALVREVAEADAECTQLESSKMKRDRARKRAAAEASDAVGAHKAHADKVHRAADRALTYALRTSACPKLMLHGTMAMCPTWYAVQFSTNVEIGC
jgi:hypothetical protein